MAFRSGASVFYTPLDLLHTRFTDLRSQMFWELIFPAQDSLVGSLMLSRTPHSLGRTSAIVIIFLFVSNLPSYMSLDCIASPPLSPSCCGSSSISLLWKIFFHVSPQIILINDCSVNDYNFRVPIGGGELRVFLLNHLSHSKIWLF